MGNTLNTTSQMGKEGLKTYSNIPSELKSKDLEPLESETA